MINAIHIKNFRSIEKCSIDIIEISGKKCFIFLGKNEAGKSNILKAISMQNPLYKMDYNVDCNKKAKKKGEDIRVELDLDVSVMNSFKASYKNLDLPKDIIKQLEVSKVEANFILSKDGFRKALYLYTQDLDTKSHLQEPTTGIYLSIEELGLARDLVDESYIKSTFPDTYKFITKGMVEKILEDRFKEEIFSLLPECIYWENSNNYLINNPVDLNSFKEDHNKSLPLLNIFKIAGIDNIKERIKIIANDYEERAQLKQELTDGVTNHINRIWPEHKINVRIEIEGTMCTVMIEDKDDTIPKYKMEQRSDGFKQFVSILLNLSTKNDVAKIIIMDEPEVHLHPSGIKYLRDELLRIAESNIVLISTHSTYMVDKLNIDRHFRVYKDKSCTYLKRLNKNNPYEEEVIYEALGTSIFEHIQPNMILFEGKTDKDIFDAFTNKFHNEIKPLNIGSISTDGVEKIPQYLKFIDNKFVKGFVIVDSDNDGKKIKNQIKKETPLNSVFEINDLLFIKENASLEDLFPQIVLIDVIRKSSGIVFFLDDTSYIKQINDKNKELGGKLNLKDLKGAFVDYILNDLNVLSKVKAKEKYQLLHDFTIAIHNAIKTTNIKAGEKIAKANGMSTA